jgi:colicin V production protein
MALKIAFGAAVALMLLFGYVGFRRDLRRGVMSLSGTLLGAILADFWAAPWGQSLAGRFVGGDSQRLTYIVSCLIFLFSVLVIGYGGGLLLGAKERVAVPRRVAGALLGVLNGALVAAYLLRFGAASDAGARELIQAWLPARILHDGLPLLFLGVTAGVALLVLVRALVVFAGRDRVTTAKAAGPPKPAIAADAPAPAAGQASDRDVLNKVHDAMRK